MAEPLILVQDLRKSYGPVEAVRGIDFEVGRGEVFGLLGPNGAGKTSTVEILEGLRPRTSGQVRVLGYDPGADTKALKDRIGVCLQQTNLPDKLRVSEALEWFGGFYSRTADPAKILDRLQLNEKKNAQYGTLSGGQRQRVAIALALINDPSIVFFDEPTTGLDPQVRLEIHGLIQQLRDDQRSIILTTHYIEEAERLCDRVAIVDEGKIVAVGTPKQILERTMGEARVEIRTETAIGELPPLNGLAHQLSEDRRTLTVWTPRPARVIADLVKWVDAGTLGLEDIHLKRPSLEDAFIKLTGKSLRD